MTDLQKVATLVAKRRQTNKQNINKVAKLLAQKRAQGMIKQAGLQKTALSPAKYLNYFSKLRPSQQRSFIKRMQGRVNAHGGSSAANWLKTLDAKEANYNRELRRLFDSSFHTPQVKNRIREVGRLLDQTRANKAYLAGKGPFANSDGFLSALKSQSTASTKMNFIDILKKLFGGGSFGKGLFFDPKAVDVQNIAQAGLPMAAAASNLGVKS